MRQGIVKGKIPSVYIQRLEPILRELKRGETLTDETILEEAPELHSTVRKGGHIASQLSKWFMSKRGVRIRRRNNAGYYLLTHAEQARCPSERAAGARRTYARGLCEGQAVDPLELNEDDRRTLEHHIRVIATQLQLATEAVHKIRWQLEGDNVEQKRLTK